MTDKTYAEKLKDPRWQKRRLEIFERDDWTCQFEKVICRSRNFDLNTIKGKNEKYLQYLDHFKTFCAGAGMFWFITTPENLIYRLGDKAKDFIVNELTIYLGD